MTRAVFAALLCAGALFGGELSNRRAPGFSLPDLTGRQHDPADYRGKYVVVEFFQSTCPHCATFADVLAEASAKYAGRVQILSIAVLPDPAQDVMKFVQAHKLRHPVLFDCGQVAASYYMATPARPSVSFPHVFVVDPQGKIIEDYGYDMMSKDIFEGRGFFREMDRILAPAKKK
jgi:peroxiredoxin